MRARFVVSPLTHPQTQGERTNAQRRTQPASQVQGTGETGPGRRGTSQKYLFLCIFCVCSISVCVHPVIGIPLPTPLPPPPSPSLPSTRATPVPAAVSTFLAKGGGGVSTYPPTTSLRDLSSTQTPPPVSPPLLPSPPQHSPALTCTTPIPDIFDPLAKPLGCRATRYCDPLRPKSVSLALPTIAAAVSERLTRGRREGACATLLALIGLSRFSCSSPYSTLCTP